MSHKTNDYFNSHEVTNMIINNNQLPFFINKVKSDQGLKNEGMESGLTAGKDLSNFQVQKKITIDTIRHQILGLQGEVKNIQTDISKKQIEIAFLENLETDARWKLNLDNFLKSNFGESHSIDDHLNKKEYIGKLYKEITGMNNDLLAREVKIENIISTGLIDDNKKSISEIIIKDLPEASNLFSKMKNESIIRVLKN